MTLVGLLFLFVCRNVVKADLFLYALDLVTTHYNYIVNKKKFISPNAFVSRNKLFFINDIIINSNMNKDLP
ncbi:hypothetical protein IMAU20078_00107 [Lactobacillus helveticus]|nr:hypothetical protein [Lactobacillus helveticus]